MFQWWVVFDFAEKITRLRGFEQLLKRWKCKNIKADFHICQVKLIFHLKTFPSRQAFLLLFLYICPRRTSDITTSRDKEFKNDIWTKPVQVNCHLNVSLCVVYLMCKTSVVHIYPHVFICHLNTVSGSMNTFVKCKNWLNWTVIF